MCSSDLHIGAWLAGAALAHGTAHRIHRVAIDVEHLPMLRMGRLQQALQGLVVGRVAACDALAQFVHCQLAVVDRPPIVERAPHQRFADARLAAGHQFTGPGRVEQVGVDVGGVAVGVEVGAWKLRRQQREDRKSVV